MILEYDRGFSNNVATHNMILTLKNKTFKKQNTFVVNNTNQFKWILKKRDLTKKLSVPAASFISSTIATAFAAPLNVIKLLSIEKNCCNFIRLLGELTPQTLLRSYFTSLARFTPRQIIEHSAFDFLSAKLCLPHNATGAVSVMLGTALMHPVDNIHVRLALNKGILPLSLNGIIPSLVQSSSTGFIWYSVMQTLTPYVKNEFALCALCSIVTNAVLHPVEVIKLTCSSRAMNVTQSISHVIRHKLFYSGFPVVMATSVPSQALAYATYYNVCKTFNVNSKSKIN